MRKLKLALAIALPVVVALLAALFLCSLNVRSEENDLGTGIGIVLFVVVNFGFIVACVPFAISFLVIEVCLFAVKKQKGTSCALLVLMSIFLPVLGIVIAVDADMFALLSPLFLIVAIATAVVYLAAYAVCILYFFACRRAASAGI